MFFLSIENPYTQYRNHRYYIIIVVVVTERLVEGMFLLFQENFLGKHIFLIEKFFLTKTTQCVYMKS